MTETSAKSTIATGHGQLSADDADRVDAKESPATGAPSFAEFVAHVDSGAPLPAATATSVRPVNTGETTPSWSGVPLAPAARTGGQTWTFDEAAAPGETSVEATGTIVDVTPTTAPAGSTFFGPMGKRRRPFAVVMLSILTLGFYGLVWHQKTNHDVADFDPQMSVRPGWSTWAVSLPWLVGLGVTAVALARIVMDLLHIALPFDPGFTAQQAWFGLPALLAVPYLELIFPLSLVAIVMTAERIRIVEERVGVPGDQQLRPAASAALLLIPVLGPIALMGRQQRRLNAVWDRVAPPAARRRR